MRKTIKIKSIVSLFTLVLMTMMLITTFSTKSEATCYSGCKPNCQYDGHFSKSYSDYYKNLGYYGQTKSVVSGKYVQGWWMYYSKDIKVEPGNTYTVNFTVSADHYYRNGELNFGITEPYEMSVVKRPAGIVNEKTSLPNNSQNINAYTNNFGYYSCYGPTVNVKYTFTVDENFQGEYATFLLEQDKAKHTCYTKHYTWNYKMGEITSVSNNGTVNVVYVDKSGNEIAPQETITGKVGTPYTTVQKDISGYNFVEVKGNPTGKITAGTQTITYVYDKITTGTVTVKHLRPNGQELAPEEILTGNVGDSYTAEPVKNKPNWHIVRVEGFETGKFTSNPQTVIFHYDRNQAGAVNVTYVDNSGKEIASPETITGKVGDNYSTTQKTIAGYTFLRNEGDPISGKLTAKEQNVVYIYESNIKSTVTIKYQDKHGKDLLTPEVLKGAVGDTYTSVAKPIENYVLKEVPANANGIFEKSAIEVIYIYEECATCDGTVIARYVDVNGKEIAPSETTKGKVGTNYYTMPKVIPNYIYKEAPDNATGQYINGTITVTYVYELCVTCGQVEVSHYLKETDGPQTTFYDKEILTGKIGQPYKANPMNIDGYKVIEIYGNVEGTFIKGTTHVVYVYGKDDPAKDGTVTVKYVDENGDNIAPVETLNGKKDEDYTTVAKDIDGYDLVKTPANANGKFIDGNIDVIYEYKAKTGTVTVKYIDEEGNDIATSDTFTGKTGTNYTTSAKNIDGYDLVKTPDNANGVYTETNIEVIYEYKAQMGTVEVIYKDDRGIVIGHGETLTGKIGSPYKTAYEEIPGYEIVQNEYPNNEEGVFTKEKIEVIYIYERTAGITQQTTTAYFEDPYGNKIGSPIVYKANDKEPFAHKINTIDGYIIIDLDISFVGIANPVDRFIANDGSYAIVSGIAKGDVEITVKVMSIED